MPINTSGGTTTSFTLTPQAGTDYLSFKEEELSGCTALLLDVMSNDLGGKSKILWSIDDGTNDSGVMNGYDAGELLTQDQLTSGVSAWQQTEKGNWIRINNGQVEYRLGNGTGLNPDQFSPPVSFDAIPEGLFTDTFIYAIRMANGTLSWATVTINIDGDNDAPTVSATAADAIVEAADASAQDISDSGTVSFDDIDTTDVIDISASYDGNLTWSGGAVLPAGLEAALTLGTFVATATDAAAPGSTPWTYTANDVDLDFLAEGETLTFSFTVTATDNFGGIATDTVSFTITGTNDAPTVSATAADAIVEAADASAQDLSDSGTVNFDDIDANDVVDISASYDGNLSWSGGTLPVGLEAALTSGTFTASATNAAAPGSTPWSYTANNVDLDFLAEGETLTFSYTVTAIDSEGATATDTVSFTITGTNDAPVLTVDTGGGVTEDVAVVAGNVSDAGTLSFSDVDVNDGHTVSSSYNDDAVWTGGALTPAQEAALAAAFSADSDSWDYSIANAALDFLGAGETITLSFDVTVTDDSGASNDEDTETVTITITGTNDAPVANNDSANTNEDTAVTFDVRSNDTDVEGDTLTVTHINGTAISVGGSVAITGGSISLGADGQLTYTPTADFNGTPSFAYTISDGNGGSSTATVNLTVTAVADAVNDSATTTAGTAVTTIVLANDNFEGSPDVTAVTQATNGSVTLNANDTVTYTPNVGFTGNDSYTYTVTSGGVTETATVNVTVNAPVVTVANIKFVPNSNNINTLDDIPAGTTIGTFVAFDAAGNVVPGITFTYTSLVGTGLTLNANGSVVAAAGLAQGSTLTFNVVPSSGSPEAVFFQAGTNSGGATGDTLPTLTPAAGAMRILLGLNAGDTLNGGGNDDTLYGGGASGNSDGLVGGAGEDYLLGGDGADNLRGEGGSDYLRGGGGTDTFVLTDSATADTIADYVLGEIVDITAILSVTTATNVVTGGYLRLTTTGLLQVDLDGGGTDWVTLANVNLGVNTTVTYDLSDGGTATVVLTPVAPPIALDLDGDGQISFLGTDAGAAFDYGGGTVATAWVGANDGILVRDGNHDGQISADEIVFATSGSDLDGLAAYDSNGDGQLSAADAGFADFGVWQDADSDGEVDAGELQSLAAHNIASISLSSDGQSYTAASGDVTVVGTGSFTRTDGSTGVLADAVFNTGGLVEAEARALAASSNNAVLLAAVAAAGLADKVAAAAQGDDDAGEQPVGSGQAMSLSASELALSANVEFDAISAGQDGMAVRQSVEAPSDGSHSSGSPVEANHSLIGSESAEPAEAPASPQALDALAEAAANAAPPTVAMPSAEMLADAFAASEAGEGDVQAVLAAVLAEGGHGSAIDAILDATLPQDMAVKIVPEVGPADLQAFASFAMEQAMQPHAAVMHPDAVASA